MQMLMEVAQHHMVGDWQAAAAGVEISPKGAGFTM